MAEIRGVAHIVINVADPEASAGFYCDVFGFRVVQPMSDQGIVGLFHPSAKVGLGLQRRAGTAVADRSAQSLDHVAFRVGDRDDLVDCVRHLATMGVDADIEDTPGGSSITLRDPDDNEVEFFAPPPRQPAD